MSRGRRFFGASKRSGLIAAAVAVSLALVAAATLTRFALVASRGVLRRSDRGPLGGVYEALRQAGVDFQAASLVVHFGLFAGLSVVAGIGLLVSARMMTVRLFMLVGAALIVLAAASELGQLWVDGRSPNLADWVADSLGVGVGLAAAVTLSRHRAMAVRP